MEYTSADQIFDERARKSKGKLEMSTIHSESLSTTVFIIEEYLKDDTIASNLFSDTEYSEEILSSKDIDSLIISVEDKVLALGYTVKKWSHSELSDLMEAKHELELINSQKKLLAVLIFLSKAALIKFSSPKYLKYWQNIMLKLKENNVLIFVPESSFSNKLVTTPTDVLLNNLVIYIDEYLNLFQQTESGYINPSTSALAAFKKRRAFSIKFKHKGTIELSIGTLETISEDIFYRSMGHSTQRLSRLERDMYYRINEISNKVDRIALSLEKNLFDPITPEIRSEIEEAKLSLKQFQTYLVEEQTRQSQKVDQLLRKFVGARGIEIVPCENRKEISLRVQKFLDDVDKGIFLHLYVPKGQYQEDQLASFLRLFENYLQRVEQLQFYIATRRTLHGTIYEFKSKETVVSLTDMGVAFSRFEAFISLCQNDQKKAEILLLEKGISSYEASRIMTKYIKEYQRLSLDIEHEKERKMLDIKQRLESEVFEIASGTHLNTLQSVQSSALFALSTNVDPLHIIISNSSVNFNSGTQSFVEQAIYGDIHYSEEDKELITLFERYAKEQEEIVQLRSELQQLKDTSLPETERKTAKQKIIGFLFTKVAPAVGQSALTVLTAYLQKILVGS